MPSRVCPGAQSPCPGASAEPHSNRCLRALLPAAEPADHAERVDHDSTLEPLRASKDRPRTHTETLPRLTQVYLALTRSGLAIDDPDQAAFRIASHVLAGHFYSRMYVALRHDAGETYTVNASNYGTIHRPTVHVLRTYTRTANADRAERIFQDTLAAFHTGGITDEERQDAIGNLAGRRLFGRQTPRQMLAEHLTERRLGLPDGLFVDLPRQAAALTLADINAFITRFYDPDEFTLVRVEAED